MLGAKVWDYTLVGLTHGRGLPPTLDQTYGEAASPRRSDIGVSLVSINAARSTPPHRRPLPTLIRT